MTKPYTIALNGEIARQKAKVALGRAPEGYRVTFEEPKRSLDQNARLWACLHDIAEQVEYYGAYRSAEDWKDIFTAAYRKSEILPGIDGASFVQIGARTSKMSKQELSELMELITAYGAQHGVTFKEAA